MSCLRVGANLPELKILGLAGVAFRSNFQNAFLTMLFHKYNNYLNIEAIYFSNETNLSINEQTGEYARTFIHTLTQAYIYIFVYVCVCAYI